MHVDDVRRLIDHFARDQVRDPLRERAVLLPGVDAVEILPILIEIDPATVKRFGVRHVDQDETALHPAWVDLRQQALQSEDGGVLVPVGSRDEGEGLARLPAVNHAHRNIHAFVGAIGNMDRSRGLCPAACRDVANLQHVLSRNQRRKSEKARQK